MGIQLNKNLKEMDNLCYLNNLVIWIFRNLVFGLIN